MHLDGKKKKKEKPPPRSSIFRNFRSAASDTDAARISSPSACNKFTTPAAPPPGLIKLMFSDSSSPRQPAKVNRPLPGVGTRPLAGARSVCTAIELQNLTSFLRRSPLSTRSFCARARAYHPGLPRSASRNPSNHRDIDRAHFRTETPDERARSFRSRGAAAASGAG